MTGLRAALAFLTPLGRATPPAPGALWAFPLIGAGLGLLLGGLWWAADEAFAPALAAALVVAADLAITGMLHLDGLADSADGLLPPLDSRERRLQVMRDPAVGAFGVGAVVIALLLRTTALASAPVDVLGVAGIWCASRTAMAAGVTLLRPARSEGLGRAFMSPSARRQGSLILLGGSVAAATMGLAGSGVRGVDAVVAVLVGATLVYWLAARRLGGVTGDVYGAAGLVGETVGLIVLAVQ